MVVAGPHHGGVGAALPAAVLRLPGDGPDPGLLPAPALQAAVPRGRPGGQQAVDRNIWNFRTYVKRYSGHATGTMVSGNNN